MSATTIKYSCPRCDSALAPLNNRPYVTYQVRTCPRCGATFTFTVRPGEPLEVKEWGT